MAIKNSKTKTQKKLTTTPQQRTAQIVFAIFAIMLILSMVFTSLAGF
ncbi:MAG: hypothetical protein IT310_06445 [Anaerolineales bacterium]|nr:hypothetical protein [Anaerolineales bacterium]